MKNTTRKCNRCGGDAEVFTSPDGLRHWRKTGLCQSCRDEDDALDRWNNIEHWDWE